MCWTLVCHVDHFQRICWLESLRAGVPVSQVDQIYSGVGGLDGLINEEDRLEL